MFNVQYTRNVITQEAKKYFLTFKCYLNSHRTEGRSSSRKTKEEKVEGPNNLIHNTAETTKK